MSSDEHVIAHPDICTCVCSQKSASLLKTFFLFQSGNHSLTNFNMEIHIQVDVLVTFLQNVNFFFFFLVNLYFMQLAYGNL